MEYFFSQAIYFTPTVSLFPSLSGPLLENAYVNTKISFCKHQNKRLRIKNIFQQVTE